MLFIFVEDSRNFSADMPQTIALDVESKRLFVERSEDPQLGWCVMCADFGNLNREVVYASGFNDDKQIAVTTAGADPIMFKAGTAICEDVMQKIQDAVLGGKSGLSYDHTAAQAAYQAWATAKKIDPAQLPPAWWEQ